MKSANHSICIVIPTYWGLPEGSLAKPSDSIFDHPTPVDGKSTLPILLASLVKLKSDIQFQVLVLVATTTPDIALLAKERILEIIKTYKKFFPITLIGYEELPYFQQLATKVGIKNTDITLNNYAGVRNMQLLAAQSLGNSLIVALDDDEFVPPDYLQIATEITNNREIIGVAGFYENIDGEIYLPEENKTGNIFQDKPIYMNLAAKKLLDVPKRWMKTPIAFGGNMLFQRELFTQVSFDPGITRGEDLDYLINAYFAGYKFWLDKSLRITHLPPKSYNTSTYLKLAEDVRRFIYQREKLIQAKKLNLSVPSIEKLSPYPGRFLQDDLENHALQALIACAPQETVSSNFPPPEKIISNALLHARELVPKYFHFAERWPKLMDFIGKDKFLQKSLTSVNQTS